MNTKYQIIFWRDIPAQVKVRSGRQRVSRVLSQRFQTAIDEAAMRAGKTDSDAYLNEWRNGPWQESDQEPEALADSLAAELEAAYTGASLRELIRQDGCHGNES